MPLHRSLPLVALVLAVPACSGAPGSTVGSTSEAISSIPGVDYSFARPSPAGLAKDGFQFVARYLSGDPDGGKDITASEAKDILAAHLHIVLVWESSGTDCTSGYDAGVDDAKAAAREASSVGQPDDRPIYFAVDFDVGSGEAPACKDYFRGAASVIGKSRTGVYGGHYIVSELFDAGIIDWAWQTYAWSSDEWDGRAQLQQYENDGACDGGCDLDRGVASDYGQWPTAAPAPAPAPGPKGFPTVSVVRRDDGYLETFARDTDDEASHVWQQAPKDGAWSSWGSLGTRELTSDLTAITNGEGRDEVFGVGEGKAVFHAWIQPDGSWSSWSSLGGELTSDVAVVLDHDKNLHLFAVGTNEELYVKSESDKSDWREWISLGGKVKSNASAAVNEDGRVEVFVLGEGGVPFHKWEREEGGWSDWSSLGGELAGRPTAVTDPEGDIELFGVGMNGEMYRTSQVTPGGAWTGWRSMGGRGFTSHVAVGTNDDGRLEVFVRGDDDHLYHAYQSKRGGEFGGFSSLGGSITSHPSVALNHAGGLEVFARGANGALFHDWQDSSGADGWSGWKSLGGKVE